MIEFFDKVLDRMPPLYARKSPTLSAVLGLLCGGIGLGIYWLSVIDTIVLVFLVVLLTIAIPGVGLVPAILLAGIYGYFRAVHSNNQLDLRERQAMNAEEAVFDVLPIELPASNSNVSIAIRPSGHFGSARIRFGCPRCGKVLKARTEQAGKRVRCPNEDCLSIVEVPSKDQNDASR